MDMSGEYRIAAPREAVWAALNDPDLLRQCIPGCEEIEKTSPTEFTAKVTAKVGPVKARFKAQKNLAARRTELADAPVHVNISAEAFIEKEPITVVCSKLGWIRAFKGHHDVLPNLTFKEGDEAGNAGGGVRLAFGLGYEIVEHGIAGLEAGDGELLLAGEIVGDAGGAQADQLGDGGEAHALEALSVEHGNGGRDDVGAAALEAVGADGAGVSFRGVARFDLGLPGQHGRECAPTGQAVGSGRRGNYSS